MQLSLISPRALFAGLVCLTFLSVGNAQSYEGNWSRDCVESADARSIHESVEFQKTSLNYSMVHHAGMNCEDPQLQFTWTADYELGGVQNTGLQNIDFALQALMLTALEDSVSEYFSQIKFCGFEDWKTNEPKDVAGKKCGDNQLGDVGYKAYNSIIAQNEVMNINFNASHPDINKRPNAKSEVTFNKVK